MPVRPITLLGSELCLHAQQGVMPGVVFDGRLGVWKDTTGGLAIHGSDLPSTRITATREGADQTERAGGRSTRITETREGVDQTERAN